MKRKKIFTILFMAGLVLAGLMAILLSVNYFSMIKLQNSTFRQANYILDNKANEVFYLFSQCNNDLKYLQQSRALSAYFENKALGMSLEYGLKINLLAISELFKKIAQTKTHKGNLIYTHLAFVTSDGNLIIDETPQHHEKQKINSDINSLSSLKPFSNFDYNKKLSAFQISIPYYFKNTLRGFIIGLISLESIYKHVTNDFDSICSDCLFLTYKNNFLLPVTKKDMPTLSTPIPFNIDDIIKRDYIEFQSTDQGDGFFDMIVMSSSIKDTPLHLLSINRKDELFPYVSPRYTLYGTIFLTLIVYGIIVFALRGIYQNLALSIRFEEASKRKEETEKKNIELKEEIAERKQIQSKLKESEERYKTLIESSSDSIFTLSRNRTILSCNKAFQKLLQYKEEEIIGKTTRIIYPSDSVFSHYGTLVYDIAEKNGTYRGELNFVKKDNSLVPVEITVSAIKKPGSGSDTFVAIMRDSSSRKAAEKQLRKAKVAAESANRAKSDFLANMSHELRTPLNHIIGFTDLVVNKYYGDLTEKQEEYLSDVLASSRHLLSLINDILDLSKIDAGKLELEPSVINLKQLLDNSLVIIKEKAMKHGINISLNIDGIPDSIFADERKLKQIVYNLLSNAVKFTHDGGKVFISASSCDPPDSVKSQIDSHNGTDCSRTQWVTISVSDTGIGISKKDHKRIFEPFEQVDSSANRKYQGTGLGLSLTKRLVELHGGIIWAESEGNGKGSMFIVSLPTVPPSSATNAIRG